MRDLGMFTTVGLLCYAQNRSRAEGTEPSTFKRSTVNI